ncbi:non-specific serine/threonine protein kinase [Malassezia nana]|uniref:non-specific serine/threonine protein kinase n=1 Tax=Malassezia nana TaxID=180528 RepID=A0AAF0J0X1_9BASI|nr:non-specific serine/threonine protein kinase [Malassezia nana]
MAAPVAQAVPGTAALQPFQGQRQLQPGMRVRIGAYLVTVQHFLSQGGFACVYLVRADAPVRLPGRPGPGDMEFVLKHMCVWDKETLATVRAEVDHHRALQGHEAIVHFVEASAASLAGGGWEVFILMEYCRGGGLIDFLNSRLHNRPTETEVLTIFRDVCEGVQVMHHHDPILVHRDLKIENVLRTTDPTRFKLCDFGSCMPLLSTQPARSNEAIRRVELDLQRHTTMPYRAPEMIDLGRHVPITEKADIWAMGVLLYKLCYYTTPFEAPGAGAPAILVGRFDVPATPVYSEELQALIRSLLQVRPDDRPDVDTLLRDVCAMLEPAAAPHHATKRPDSLLIDLDEAATRFPSVKELDASRPAPSAPETPPTRSVRAMVDAMNQGVAHPPVRDRPLSVSISMESPSGTPAHTLVDVDVSSSSDDEPEDAGATYRVRVRPRPNTEPAPNAAEDLHDLLVHAENQADTSAASASAPAADELVSLAEQERALQGLLSGTHIDTPPTRSTQPESLVERRASSAPLVPAEGASPPTRGAVLPPRAPRVRPKPPALALNAHTRAMVRAPVMPVPSSSFSEAPTQASSSPRDEPRVASEADELPAARRAPAWDKASPPPRTKTYVDASTSPRRPSPVESPTSSPPTHGIDAGTATIAPKPQYALPMSRSQSTQSATPVLRGVRLTKRETQGSSEASAAPSKPTPARLEDESAPSESVRVMIQKWQSQVR